MSPIVNSNASEATLRDACPFPKEQRNSYAHVSRELFTVWAFVCALNTTQPQVKTTRTLRCSDEEVKVRSHYNDVSRLWFMTA